MSISSMTGFARAEGQAADMGWAWELKSVNGRSLDVRCRLASGMDGLEPAVRAAVTSRLKRGNVTAGLRLTRGGGEGTPSINRELLSHYCALAKEIEGLAGVSGARADGLLALRGVIEIGEREEAEEVRTARETAVLATLDQALDRMEEARLGEGGRLAIVVGDQLDEVERLVEAAENSAAARPEAMRERLKKGVEELLGAAPALPEERLAQELAVLITKTDVREELDRLGAHVASARELLASDGATGRRLDFLAQELNREANTICSKAADVDLNRIGLDLKTVIDQFREQVQNIE